MEGIRRAGFAEPWSDPGDDRLGVTRSRTLLTAEIQEARPQVTVFPPASAFSTGGFVAVWEGAIGHHLLWSEDFDHAIFGAVFSSEGHLLHVDGEAVTVLSSSEQRESSPVLAADGDRVVLVYSAVAPDLGLLPASAC